VTARRQPWPPPATASPAPVRQGFGSTAVAVSLVSWWYVTWRARVLDVSTGDVEAHLSAIGDALAQLDVIGGVPGVRLIGPSSVIFEFWFEAATTREAAGGARIALRQACKAVGVGDPTPLTGRPGAVMVMFEELPALHRDDSPRKAN
jgi:hypothetical protein